MRAFESAHSFTVSTPHREPRLFSDCSVNQFKTIQMLVRMKSKHKMLCLCRESG